MDCGSVPSGRKAAAKLDLARSGGHDAHIEILEYHPSWPARYQAEAKRLAPIVPPLEWHHIGSTAVLGLAAKPIIDMMALVEDLDEHVPPLVARASYQFPEAFNALLLGRRWLCRPSAGYRTHHLHLVSDQRELDRHLHFRDALRRDPRLAFEYAALKRSLAARMAGDREGYTAAKTAFIREAEAHT